MARAIYRLTAKEIQTLKKPGRHADGGGLYLAIDPTGQRKRWTFLFKLNGRQREAGLGSLSDVTLAEARRKADAMRAALRDGLDPLEKKAEETAALVTFGQAALEYIDAHKSGWKNPKHIAQWEMTMSVQRDSDGAWIDAGYCTAIRDRPVADISTEDVLAILSPIWASKNETAARTRGRIEMVLDAAKAKKQRSGDNPAAWKGHLALMLAKRDRLQRGHHAAMPYEDVPAFVAKLRMVRGMAALALEFTILTAARTGEVLGATWGEIDLDARIWTVPAARMKGGREHRVPLPARPVEILRLVGQIDHGPDDYIFPGMRRGRPLSNMAMDMLMRRHAPNLTVHGFRSSVRDWAGDATHFPREVAEAALAHAIGDETEAAYRRGDALEKRRAMMDAWATFLEG